MLPGARDACPNPLKLLAGPLGSGYPRGAALKRSRQWCFHLRDYTAGNDESCSLVSRDPGDPNVVVQVPEVEEKGKIAFDIGAGLEEQ